jgi:hypothetical protein
MNQYITPLILLIVVGAILFLVDRLPIDGTVKLIIKVTAIVILLIYAIKFLAGML